MGKTLTLISVEMEEREREPLSLSLTLSAKLVCHFLNVRGPFCSALALKDNARANQTT